MSIHNEMLHWLMEELWHTIKVRCNNNPELALYFLLRLTCGFTTKADVCQQMKKLKSEFTCAECHRLEAQLAETLEDLWRDWQDRISSS